MLLCKKIARAPGAIKLFVFNRKNTNNCRGSKNSSTCLKPLHRYGAQIYSSESLKKGKLRNDPPQNWVNIGWSGAIPELHKSIRI